jgi:hypothetical protein
VALQGPLALGLVLGGSASAFGFWLLSGLAHPIWAPVRAGLLMVLVLAALATDALGLRWPWPQNARQVPQTVRRRAPAVAMLQFGFELGSGLRTFITSRAPYVVGGVLLLGGLSLPTALALGAGFGAGRALMPLMRAWHPHPSDWDHRLERMSRLLKVTATSLGGCAALWIAVVELW